LIAILLLYYQQIHQLHRFTTARKVCYDDVMLISFSYFFIWASGEKFIIQDNALEFFQLSGQRVSIPQHLHRLHAQHLHNCKLRRNLPTSDELQHPAHPQYRSFLEQLLRHQQNLRAKNNELLLNSTRGRPFNWQQQEQKSGESNIDNWSTKCYCC
jgi:hypothetical protein